MTTEIIDSKTKKRKPKTSVQMDVQLNEEQKEATKILMDNDIIILFGKAGSGKTLLSANYALKSFFNSDINRIYITRPTVSKEEIGFLPGTLESKLDPWLQPIYENFKTAYGSTEAKKNKLKKMIEDEDIKIQPVAFMRGITITDSILICDEAQNITKEQIKMIITRIGKGGKIIFSGDIAQIDLKKKQDSGLGYLIRIGQGIEGFSTVELTSNHRHPILDEFIKRFDEDENK